MTIKKPNYANLPVTPYNFDSCTRKKEIINEPEQISFTDRVYLFFFQQLFLREKAMEARYNEDSRLNSTRLHVSPKEFREKKRKKKKEPFVPHPRVRNLTSIYVYIAGASSGTDLIDFWRSDADVHH